MRSLWRTLSRVAAWVERVVDRVVSWAVVKGIVLVRVLCVSRLFLFERWLQYLRYVGLIVEVFFWRERSYMRFFPLVHVNVVCSSH